MSDNRTDTPTLNCSFCKQNEHKVAKLFTSSTVAICDECAWLSWCTIADVSPSKELFDEVIAFMRERCPASSGEA